MSGDRDNNDDDVDDDNDGGGDDDNGGGEDDNGGGEDNGCHKEQVCDVRLAEVETCPFVLSHGREDAADGC